MRFPRTAFIGFCKVSKRQQQLEWQGLRVGSPCKLMVLLWPGKAAPAAKKPGSAPPAAPISKAEASGTKRAHGEPTDSAPSTAHAAAEPAGSVPPVGKARAAAARVKTEETVAHGVKSESEPAEPAPGAREAGGAPADAVPTVKAEAEPIGAAASAVAAAAQDSLAEDGGTQDRAGCAANPGVPEVLERQGPDGKQDAGASGAAVDATSVGAPRRAATAAVPCSRYYAIVK